MSKKSGPWNKISESARLFGRPKAKRREPDAADKFLSRAKRKKSRK